MVFREKEKNEANVCFLKISHEIDNCLKILKKDKTQIINIKNE